MKRILLIDDEELVRYTLQNILEEAGYDVETAENGRKGLEKFRANPYDLVISDLVMPERGGLQTIIDMIRDDPSVKIVAISSAARSRGVKIGSSISQVASIFS